MHRLLINYNYWAHRQLWDCILTISEADFKKPVSYSMGSVHEQVVHVIRAEAMYYARIHAEPIPEFNHLDYPDYASIRAKWDEVEGRWRDYMAGITDTEINRPQEFIRANGERYVFKVGALIMHMVNHGTDHRAQMLELIHGYGGETFAQDMLYYMMDDYNLMT